MTFPGQAQSMLEEMDEMGNIGSSGGGASGTQANPVNTSGMSQADLNALPSGTYIMHNGVVRKKT